MRGSCSRRLPFRGNRCRARGSRPPFRSAESPSRRRRTPPRRLLREFRAKRLVDRPNRFRKLLLDLATQPLTRRRVVLFEEESEAGAVAGILQNFVERLFKGRRVRRPAIRECAGAVRIVKIKDRRLRKRVRGTFADRMKRVAFDLRRTAIVGRRDKRRVAMTRRARRRKEERLAGDGPLDATRERNEMLFGPAARAQAQTPRAPSMRPSASGNSGGRHRRPAIRRRLAEIPAPASREIPACPPVARANASIFCRSTGSEGC